MIVQSENLNEVFQSYTVDQLRSYVRSTRKDIRAKQDELRQLVGDRYHDLIAASDMVVDMGAVCKDLLTIYDRPSAFKASALSDDQRIQKAAAMRAGRLQHLLRTCSVAPQEVWQWMDGGLYLDATLTLLQAQAAMVEAVRLLKAPGGDTKDPALAAQLQLANRLGRQLQDLPRTITQHAAEHLTLLKAPPPSLPSPSFLAHYSECFCSLLLLRDLTFQDTIVEFLAMRADHLKTLAGQPAVPHVAEALVGAVQSALRFLHAVFLSQTLPMSPLGAADGGGGGGGEAEVLARVYRTVSSLGATSPLVKAAQARLARPLPPKADVERACAAWVQEAYPLVLDGIRGVLQMCQHVKDAMELEDAVLQLVSAFTAAYSPGPDVAAGTPLPKAVWNGDQWAKGITQLVSARVEELMRELVRTLKADSLARLRGQPDWGASPLQLSFASLTPGLRPQDSKAWCAAVIGDQEVAARYSLIGAQPAATDSSTLTNALLPSALLDPSMVPLAHEVCSDFHARLAAVLTDAARVILRERQATATALPSCRAGQLELLLHSELTTALRSVCDELGELSTGHELIDGKAAVIGYTSQGLSTVIDALGGPFVARLSSKPAPGTPGKQPLPPASSLEWKKEDWAGVLQQLHQLYMQAHQSWIQGTVAAIALDLEANLQRSYFGPDPGVCRKLHASTWVIKRGDDGALLHLPCMPQAFVFQSLYDTCQAIRGRNVSMLRLAVVRELHRRLALAVVEAYRKFVADPAAALGYAEPDGDGTNLICEEGWLQLLFDVRVIGALLLPRPHAAILGHAEGDAAAPLGPEEAAYAALYRRIEESIDLINWNAYQAPLEGVLTGFLHSVSGLFACHAIDHQPWARREKEKEKDAQQREKDERVGLLALAPECDRFPLLPILPLNMQAQSALRQLPTPAPALLDRGPASTTPGTAAVTSGAPPTGGPGLAADPAASAARLVSRISGVTGVKKLWGMFDKA
eukprot:EG_transcript_1529